MESCEGDSGVGSDMVNPQEREDQGIDDLHQVDQFDQPDKDMETEDPLAMTENDGGQVNEQNDEENEGNEFREREDPEELEALATCRKTIENLRSLGEHSR